MLNGERNRVNIIQSKRTDYAEMEIEDLGYKVTRVDDNLITFKYKGKTIQFFPYTGWASGRGIKDCRGIKNLIKQIKV